MILQPGYSIRSFTLHNRINRLKVTIFNIGAAITSIKTDFGKEEIIRSSVSNNDEHEWQSHVLGLDTLLLNISSTTLMYQLTSENELAVTGKFRGQQHFDVISPFYFNLVSLLRSSDLRIADISDPPCLTCRILNHPPSMAIISTSNAARITPNVINFQH